MKRSVVVAAVSGACLALASAASAATICVAPATGCEQSAGTIAGAFSAAKSAGGENTIKLGATTYSEDGLVWDGAGRLTIEGAGATETTIQRATATDAAMTLYLNGSQPVDLKALRVHLSGSAMSQVGLRAEGAGGHLSSLAFDTDPLAQGPDAIELISGGWTVSGVNIDMKGTNGGCIYTGAPNAQFSDSTLGGCSIAIVGGGGFTAQRLSISDVSIGVDVAAGQNVVEDTLISDAENGVYLALGGGIASLTVRHTTMIGSAPSVDGVHCENGSSSASSAGTITISDSIISGFTTSIFSHGSAGGATCAVTAMRDNYTAPQDVGQNGSVSPTNKTIADPGFIDPSHGNYRLGPTSTLVNLESAPLPAGESTTDLDGGLRVIGTGRDLGAYERPLAQSATTGSASSITGTSARLGGTVNSGGGAGSWKFVYGLTSAYGSETTDTPLTASLGDQAVAKTLTGLQPDSTYHYQLVMTTPYGVVKSADATFITDRTPPTVTISSPMHGATVVNSPVTVSGNATDNVRVTSLTVNAKPVGVGASGAWSLKVALHPGPNAIVVVARDAVGNQRKVQITVKYLVAQMSLQSLRFDRGHKQVLVRLACKAGGATCKGKVTISRKGSPVLGSAGYAIAAGRTATVKVGLNAKGKALLKRMARVTTTVVITLTQPNGRTATFAARPLTLK